MNFGILRFAFVLALPAMASDWRVDLLQEEEIGITPTELKKAASGFRIVEADLATAYEGLGAENYPDRERAQRTFLSAGPGALEWLRNQAVPENPEIRIRVAKIRGNLQFPSIGGRDRMINHAATSLLKDPDSPAAGGVFFEWFGEGAESLAEGYRKLGFEAGVGLLGEVKQGQLVFKGDHPGDGDQRLILNAAKWPGRDTFPSEFSISAKLGGTEGGMGAWHLGISVGEVRALYHPGLGGGSFRFEQVGTRKELTTNESMGFAPSTSHLQRMLLNVKRLSDGSAELSVVIDQQGSDRFERTWKAPAEAIGKIDQISLDRSGRAGGDAHFDDFVIEFIRLPTAP